MEPAVYAIPKQIANVRKPFGAGVFSIFSLNNSAKTSEIWNMMQHHYKYTSGNASVKALSHRILSCEQRILDFMENELIDALSEEKYGEKFSMIFWVVSIDLGLKLENFVLF